MLQICNNNYIWQHLIRNVLQINLETIENYHTIVDWKLYFKEHLYFFTSMHGANIKVEAPMQASILHLTRWETVQVNRTLMRGNTYRIAFQLTRLVSHQNSYEIVIGVTAPSFDYLQVKADHTVIGHGVSPDGIGLAVQNNSILNYGWKNTAPYGNDQQQAQVPNATTGDIYGIVLKHGAVESKLRFYKNGKVIRKIKGKMPDAMYFGVSLYKEQTVTIVPFKK